MTKRVAVVAFVTHVCAPVFSRAQLEHPGPGVDSAIAVDLGHDGEGTRIFFFGDGSWSPESMHVGDTGAPLTRDVPYVLGYVDATDLHRWAFRYDPETNCSGLDHGAL